MNKVLSSRRLWTFVVGSVLDVAGVVVIHYVNDPFTLDLVKMGMTFVTGMAGILITAYTVDDVTSNVAAIKAGSHPQYIPHNKQ